MRDGVEINPATGEAVAVWVIGLDSQEPLTVSTLTGPGRLVLDIEQ
jgi:hypothetical protein